MPGFKLTGLLGSEARLGVLVSEASDGGLAREASLPPEASQESRVSNIETKETALS